ncbi:probable protein phosphatase 2C 22 [Dendrobium catenatum]|uniref:probable protein phosphatase 2C 22 n=1 Tax=Dendrobium catenatum TaxID=906689 RepID=UPI0009F736ED|nr:probable protein phosphatase 2C 22 [Dendrobium catenatum]
MEGSVRGGIGNAGSSESRPPNPLAGANRQCFAGVNAGHTPISGTLVRHTSLKQISSIPIEPEVSGKKCEKEYIPIVRSGAYVDIGFRQNMEDTYVCCDNVTDEYCLKNTGDGPNAFYGVFDGHGGKHAAEFVCSNLLRFIMEDEDFPKHIEKVITSAFLHADTAFAEACSVDSALASGTTALAALIVGRSGSLPLARDDRIASLHFVDFIFLPVLSS